MLGWFSAEAERASFSKRLNREASRETSSGSTFSATSRARRESRARYTSPMPPAPSGPATSYGPMVVPSASVTNPWDGFYVSAGRLSQPLDEVQLREPAEVAINAGLAVG